MKVLRISSYDGAIDTVSAADWEDMSKDIDESVEEGLVEIHDGPDGILNYVFEEDMFLVIPD
jgi:hypothetical protein